MKKLVLVLAALFLFAHGVQAQTIVGPATQFLWDVNAPTPAFAQSLTYNVTVAGVSTAPITLTGVTCVTSTVNLQTCNVPVTQIPLGSVTVTMTSASGSIVSLPSSPFTYVTLVIPVPSNQRFK